MLGFKDILNRDTDIFINLNEFADVHLINGVAVKCVIDDDIDRANRAGAKSEAFAERYKNGIEYDYTTLYIKASDYGTEPKPNTMIRVDTTSYLIKKVIKRGSIYELDLQNNTY